MEWVCWQCVCASVQTRACVCLRVFSECFCCVYTCLDVCLSISCVWMCQSESLCMWVCPTVFMPHCVCLSLTVDGRLRRSLSILLHLSPCSDGQEALLPLAQLPESHVEVLPSYLCPWVQGLQCCSGVVEWCQQTPREGLLPHSLQEAFPADWPGCSQPCVREVLTPVHGEQRAEPVCTTGQEIPVLPGRVIIHLAELCALLR